MSHEIHMLRLANEKLRRRNALLERRAMRTRDSITVMKKRVVAVSYQFRSDVGSVLKDQARKSAISNLMDEVRNHVDVRHDRRPFEDHFEARIAIFDPTHSGIVIP